VNFDDDINDDDARRSDHLEALLLVERMLGAAMRTPSIMDRVVAAGVIGSDFESIQHAHIWTAMLATHARHGKVDVGIVEAHLREHLQWKSADVRQWLRSVEAAAPSTLTDDAIALGVERIRYAAGMRRFRALASDVAMAASEKKKTIAEIASSAAREIESIVSGTVTSKARTGIDLVADTRARLNGQKPTTHRRVPTGIPEIDKLFRGQGPRSGGALVVGAKTGVGKTTTAAFLANSALEHGARVHIISLEMSDSDIVDTMIGMRAGVAVDDAKTPEQWSRVHDAMAFCSTARLTIEKLEAVTAEEIASKVHAIRQTMTASGDAGALVVEVDYLQAITLSTRHQRSDQNYAHVSMTLRRTWERYDVSAVLFSQVATAKDAREEKINGPSDTQLGETQQWAKDAIAVLMLDRDKDSDDDRKANTTRMKLTKNRHDRKLGRAWMFYDVNTTRWLPCDAHGRTGGDAEKKTTVAVDDEDLWTSPSTGVAR